MGRQREIRRYRENRSSPPGPRKNRCTLLSRSSKRTVVSNGRKTEMVFITLATRCHCVRRFLDIWPVYVNSSSNRDFHHLKHDWSCGDFSQIIEIFFFFCHVKPESPRSRAPAQVAIVRQRSTASLSRVGNSLKSRQMRAPEGEGGEGSTSWRRIIFRKTRCDTTSAV